MKNILLLFLLLLPFVSYSQSTINPDTVCYQTPGSIYTQPALAGYTFTWVVSAPGIITSGQNTNQINVNWSGASPGLIANAVSVSAVNTAGCQTQPVDLDVFILQVVPLITAIGPFCVGELCVNLVASPAGGAFSGTGVSANQFCPTVAGQGTFNIGYSVTVGGCTFNATLPVTVSTAPALAPISHN
jgi:hypothetical protein